MGWNTVAIIMNDAIEVIANDEGFGRRLAHETMSLMRRKCEGRRADVPARSDRAIYVNAATVISKDHANGYQVIIAHANSGWRCDTDDELPDDVERALVECLKRRGYHVSKQKAKVAS